MATFIVLLGPPGAGKGTQAQIISETMNLPHISTGDLFREHLKNQTELGKEAQTYMSKGQLVPDSLTIEMVKDRLSRKDCENGALLDGFPRTSAQAEAFDKMLAESFNGKVDCVPCIEVDTELLIDRLCGRWMCPNGHVFHKTFNPPKESGVCDICGCALYQRDDDKIETVSKRIDVYEAQTAPLIKYYEQQNVLQRIDGTQSIDLVSRDILDVLKKIAK
jgi:adenylate kinase